MRSDPRIDAYIDHAAPFARPILHLRALVAEQYPSGEEMIKWGWPSILYHGAMRGGCRHRCLETTIAQLEEGKHLIWKHERC